MKIPVSPPDIAALWSQLISEEPQRLLDTLKAARGLGIAPGGKYRHWDEFRHIDLGDGLSAERRWLVVKQARQSVYRQIPLNDVRGNAFQYCLPAAANELLHHIDRDAAGTIGALEPVANAQTQATYLLKSLTEEAIRSSQLEGASTTRRVAKDMILEGRKPRDRSETMIFNNYTAMQRVREVKGEPLTPALIMELQAILTEGTLDEPDAAGRFRRDDEHIVVSDDIGNILHDPPRAPELRDRLKRLCDFANGGGTTEFMHPVIRAILVHFALAYDHPFVDGNGRTARALFYWVMAREGYWLGEFISISRVLRKAPAKYSRSFLYTETDDNDATYFLLHQLEVLNSAIRELHEYLRRKTSEVKEIEELARRSSSLRQLNNRQLDLLTHAMKNPGAVYSIESHRRAHEIAYATSRSDLLNLADLNLLDNRKGGRSFVFVAPDNLRERIDKRQRRKRSQ